MCSNGGNQRETGVRGKQGSGIHIHKLLMERGGYREPIGPQSPRGETADARQVFFRPRRDSFCFWDGNSGDTILISPAALAWGQSCHAESLPDARPPRQPALPQSLTVSPIPRSPNSTLETPAPDPWRFFALGQEHDSRRGEHPFEASPERLSTFAPVRPDARLGRSGTAAHHLV